HSEQPDREAFPSLQLGYEAARHGGTCGAVLNAANEEAVRRFLAGELRFLDIPRVCRAVLDHHHYSARPTLAELAGLDRWARQEVARWLAFPNPSPPTPGPRPPHPLPRPSRKRATPTTRCCRHATGCGATGPTCCSSSAASCSSTGGSAWAACSTSSRPHLGSASSFSSTSWATSASPSGATSMSTPSASASVRARPPAPGPGPSPL